MDVKSIINQILFENKDPMVRGEGDPVAPASVEPHLSVDSPDADADSGVLGAGKDRTREDKQQTRDTELARLGQKGHFNNIKPSIIKRVKEATGSKIMGNLHKIKFLYEQGSGVYNAFKKALADLDREIGEDVAKLSALLNDYNETLKDHKNRYTKGIATAYWTLPENEYRQPLDKISQEKRVDFFYDFLSSISDRVPPHLFKYILGDLGIDISLSSLKESRDRINVSDPEKAVHTLHSFFTWVAGQPFYSKIKDISKSIIDTLVSVDKNRQVYKALEYKIKKLRNLYNEDGTLKNKPQIKQKVAAEVSQPVADKFTDDDDLMYVILGDDEEMIVDAQEEFNNARNKFIQDLVDEKMADEVDKEEIDEPKDDTLTESKKPEPETIKTRTRQVSEKTRLREIWENNKKEIFTKNISNEPDKKDSGLHLGGL